ncbi:hypothetical protein B5S29_g2471 [[Candida] boidinii]|uniref:Unnamed protein product n=1 Tax=Candida boidinii TaxID=5477 RepID=A0ACB5TT39_CANBO|nr:hypothetical protein B5S29_g2471 [[Candida] boidinii]GME94811.1 unnamed protein product [[Candida] boidinii]
MSSDQFTSVQWDRDEPEFTHEGETIEESDETQTDNNKTPLTDTQNTDTNTTTNNIHTDPIIEANEDDSQIAGTDTNKDTADNSTVKSITSIDETHNESHDNKDTIDALTDNKHIETDKHISNEEIGINEEDDELDKSQPDLLATETSNFSLITGHGQSKSSLNAVDTTITEDTATTAAAIAQQENNTNQGIGQQAYIIDDDFNNIHQHHNQQQQQQHIESDEQDSKYFIETSVSSPITDYEGQNPFVSYLIRTKTNNPKFKSKFFQVRRRYSDFNFLFECLSNDFPAVIIPPLPNKQRLEYIKGGRFTEEFTNKRAISLNNFLSRLCEHPILSKTHLFHTFLENSDYWNTIKSNLKIIGGGNGNGNNSNNNNSNNNGNRNSNDATQNLETVSDYIMNAFKKPNFESKNSKEFQEIYDKSTKLQENLNKVDIIYSKVLKRQNDLADDFARFSDEFSKLTILLDSDFNLRPDNEINKNSNNDKKLKNLSTNKSSSSSSELQSHQIISKKFGLFSDNLKKFSDRSHSLNHQIEYNYLTSLRDLEHYITSLKNILKLKDAKSLDYEMLTNYLEKAEQERTYLMNGGSITSTTEGALSFLSRKFESLTTGHSSINSSGNLTNERIEKLNSRIEMLKKEKQNSLDLFNNFEIQVLKEYSYFEKIKNDEINNSLRHLSDSYLEYYTNLLNDWNNLDIDINQNEFSKLSINKLSNDSELFGENDVLKNQDILNQDIAKLTQKLSDSKLNNDDNNTQIIPETETETDL